ncbi:MAG: DUF465 domain-containing protein [Gammaproteobacteria bacterium]|nr:DUF465 domain-containing protein [Gammaproteobacteria bacterium]
MSIEKHNLVLEFPESKDAIHALKTGNQHFSRLFEQYDDVAHEVRRIETGVETTSDEYLEKKKKERLKLKDELYGMIMAFGK